LSPPGFCRRQHFVHADILSTPTFCRRVYFVDTNNFVDADIWSTPIIFCCVYFVDTNILSPPIFLILFRLGMIICSNDCVLCIS
jgi:hypothetical protein